MNINRSSADTLKPTILMNKRNKDALISIEKQIKSVKASNDLPSSSSHDATTYEHFLPASLLNKIKFDPTFKQKCLADLNIAIKNKTEKATSRAKFMMVKMLLQGHSLENVFAYRNAICTTYKAGLRLSQKESIALMLEYYLVGGLKLLRGFPNASYSSPHSASTMNFVLNLFEENTALYTSGFKINTAIKKRIEMGEHFKEIDICSIPTSNIIDGFIANCGYKKNQEGEWIFAHGLTKSAASIAEKKHAEKLPRLQIEQGISDNETNGINISDFELAKPAMLANLEAAIKNDFETDKDKFKFTAVKMLLNGFTHEEILDQCSALFLNSRGRQIDWNPKKLNLLLTNYLLGGLHFLRAFSFKSSFYIPRLKTMRFIMKLFEDNPIKGNAAVLGTYKRMLLLDRLPKDMDTSFLPTNTHWHTFIARCGYEKVENKWVMRPNLTPNIIIDEVEQAKLCAEAFSLAKISKKAYQQASSPPLYPSLENEYREDIGMDKDNFDVGLLETLLQSPLNSLEIPTSPLTLFDDAQEETENGTNLCELLGDAMRLLSSPSHPSIAEETLNAPPNSASIVQNVMDLEELENLEALIALEKNKSTTHSPSLTSALESSTSFLHANNNAISSCYVEKDFIEGSELETTDNFGAYASTEQGVEIESNEIVPPSPEADTEDLSEYLFQFGSPNSPEIPVIKPNFGHLSSFQYSLNPLSFDFESSNNLYLQQEEAQISNYTLDNTSTKTTKRQNDEDLPFSHKKIKLTSELNASNQQQSNDWKNLFDNLQAAIDNSAEKVANKIKFTAIKMLLEGRSYDETSAYCNFISTDNLTNHILWTDKKLELLLDYYLEGGLYFVRAFSFKSRDDIFIPKTMGFIMKRLEEYPENGSVALINSIKKMILADKLPTNINIDAFSLPPAPSLDMFLLRCGYKRLQKKWVFNSKLTPNVPIDLKKEQILNRGSQTINNPNSIKLNFHQNEKIKPAPLKTSTDFSDLILDDETRIINLNELNRALKNHSENGASKIKFFIVKSMLENKEHREIEKDCYYLFEKYDLKAIKLPKQKMLAMRDYYLAGGLAQLRGFAWALPKTYPAELMQLGIKLIETDPKQLLTAVHDKLNRVNRDLSPGQTAFARFIERCGYYRNDDESWEMHPSLTISNAQDASLSVSEEESSSNGLPSSHATIAEILSLVEQDPHLSLRKLAKKTKCSVHKIRRLLKRHGYIHLESGWKKSIDQELYQSL